MNLAHLAHLAPLRRISRRQTGYSLAELLVTLLIAAILSMLAMPAWRHHLERAWRVQARAELVSAMLALERHALLTTSFASTPGAATPAGQWPRPVPPPPARTRHWLTATSCAGLDLSRCVEIRATPVHVDKACGTLILRSNGEWLSMPTADATAIPLPWEC
ncbi:MULTISPECIES: type IV pilin protein [Cupriavidus]|uniref:type IV pilin protein n=1 Tax=Cupriavidus TaxID=106589 RepID=UPI0002A1EC8A|nr:MULTISPECIES: prepilin-type N-terminal cleavage/methylation domain-containing protein [Cupriavidus]ELA00724.1 putative type IV pilus assembly protein (PilE-like) [Cupriavidus sp. HMR-1]